MSERRRILSRPRTKVYDCNYNIGERYYKPMVDHLDRKYSGRPDIPSVNLDAEDGRVLDGPSKRAAQLLAEFDSSKTNGATPSNRASLLVDDDADEEFNATMKRLKASRAARNAELENEFDAFASKSESKRRINMSEKLLDSVGLSNRSQHALEDDIFFKKRTLRVMDEDDGAKSHDKWVAVRPGAKALQDAEESADEVTAIARARKSRARIADLDAELEDMAERTAARQKRVEGLRALVAESDTNSAAATSSIKVTKRVTSVKATAEKKQVSF